MKLFLDTAHLSDIRTADEERLFQHPLTDVGTGHFNGDGEAYQRALAAKRV